MSMIEYLTVKLLPLDEIGAPTEYCWWPYRHHHDTDGKWDGAHIIAVDFDGVIHNYTSKFTTIGDIADEPVHGAIPWLELLLNNNFRVAIYSLRCAQQEGILGIAAWLHKNGMSHENVERLHFYHQKPMASVFIDDRAFHFEGTFPTVQYLTQFRPWNKK